MKKSLIVAVMGPTASGKTDLGLRLAKCFSGEVVNADTRQMYRDGAIGTGLPSGAWEAVQDAPSYIVEGISHHLMAMNRVEDVWTVSQWKTSAEESIAGIFSRAHLPIVVGGTGLYIRALAEGFAFSGEPDHRLREELLRISEGERRGRLLALDKDAGRYVDLQNPHRVLRALERRLSHQPPPTRVEPLFDTCKIAIAWTSEELRSRIATRIHQQFQDGWVEEVAQLLGRGVSLTCPLMQSIGFRTIASVVTSTNIPNKDILEERVFAETWQYARRQMTWLRKEPSLQWVSSTEEAISFVEKAIEVRALLKD